MHGDPNSDFAAAMPSSSMANLKVLIVDDEPANVLLLERILSRAGYKNITAITNPVEVLQLTDALCPDIILLDLHMPELDGYAVLDWLTASGRDKYLPVLVLTADVTQTAKKRALSSGAKDFLVKPFDPLEVLLRTKILLETRQLHLRLLGQNIDLSDKVKKTSNDLDAAIYEIVHRLAIAAEFRDDQTGQHTNRVAHMAALVGEAMGFSPEHTELLRKAAPLHDIGKIGISDLILLKPGKLTADEFKTMKKHARIGSNILSGSSYPLLQMAEVIARTHHERWDGCGYHAGLKGTEIPLEGRILAVVDVFDALTNDRPYKIAWSWAEALEEIQKGSGSQFDPDVVRVFLQLVADGRIFKSEDERTVRI